MASSDRGMTWTREETDLLLSIRAEKGINSQFIGNARDCKLYQHIADRLAQAGAQRTKKQVNTKLKSLKRLFLQIKAGPKTTGDPRMRFPYYDSCLSIWGNDASADNGESDADSEEGEILMPDRSLESEVTNMLDTSTPSPLHFSRSVPQISKVDTMLDRSKDLIRAKSAGRTGDFHVEDSQAFCQPVASPTGSSGSRALSSLPVETESRKLKGRHWTLNEESILLRMRVEEGIVSNFVGNARDSILYEHIANRLAQVGIQRTSKQVITKLKNLKKLFLQMKSGNLKGDPHMRSPLYDLCCSIWDNGSILNTDVGTSEQTSVGHSDAHGMESDGASNQSDAGSDNGESWMLCEDGGELPQPEDEDPTRAYVCASQSPSTRSSVPEFAPVVPKQEGRLLEEAAGLAENCGDLDSPSVPGRAVTQQGNSCQEAMTGSPQEACTDQRHLWTAEEESLLLTIRGEPEIKAWLADSSHDGTVYQHIAGRLKQAGSHHSVEQVISKLKSLKRAYFQLHGSHITGEEVKNNFPYDACSSIWGNGSSSENPRSSAVVINVKRDNSEEFESDGGSEEEETSWMLFDDQEEANADLVSEHGVESNPTLTHSSVPFCAPTVSTFTDDIQSRFEGSRLAGTGQVADRSHTLLDPAASQLRFNRTFIRVPRDRCLNWTEEEERLLLRIRSEDAINSKISGFCGDGIIHQHIADRLAEAGIHRTRKQVTTKLKNLRKLFRKIRAMPEACGQMRKRFLYDECFAIWGNTTGTEPPKAGKSSAPGLAIVRRNNGSAVDRDVGSENGEGWMVYDDQEEAMELRNVHPGSENMSSSTSSSTSVPSSVLGGGTRQDTSRAQEGSNGEFAEKSREPHASQTVSKPSVTQPGNSCRLSGIDTSTRPGFQDRANSMCNLETIKTAPSALGASIPVTPKTYSYASSRKRSLPGTRALSASSACSPSGMRSPPIAATSLSSLGRRRKHFQQFHSERVRRSNIEIQKLIEERNLFVEKRKKVVEETSLIRLQKQHVQLQIQKLKQEIDERKVQRPESDECSSKGES